MKNGLLLLAAIFFLSYSTMAQEPVYRSVPCSDTAIARQADSIKHVVEKDGFTLLREASITMESEYEIPVIVPLQQGGLYHFVFIGAPTSRLLEVRMYDWNQDLIIYQKRSGAETNIVSFSYVPNVTLHHMFNSVQVNKKTKKGLCGYVMLFKKTAAAK